ncbi:MAG: hypothetical protein JO125_10430 [Chloroflexi bacterium]|nr:hypothetical protein [Chloroflexota bacterium]
MTFSWRTACEPLADLLTSLEGRLGLLLGYLREQRALLALDNLGVSAGGRRKDGPHACWLRRVRQGAVSDILQHSHYLSPMLL